MKTDHIFAFVIYGGLLGAFIYHRWSARKNAAILRAQLNQDTPFIIPELVRSGGRLTKLATIKVNGLEGVIQIAYSDTMPSISGKALQRNETDVAGAMLDIAIAQKQQTPNIVLTITLDSPVPHIICISKDRWELEHMQPFLRKI